MARILQLLLVLVCCLIAAYAAWISLWVFAKGHIPFGPLIGAIIAITIARRAWPGHRTQASPSDDGQATAQDVCRADLGLLLQRLQIAVFGQAVTGFTHGAQVTQWTGEFVEIKAQGQSERNLVRLKGAAAAMMRAHGKLSRLARAEGPEGAKKPTDLLREAQEDLDLANRCLREVENHAKPEQSTLWKPGSPVVVISRRCEPPDIVESN